jgi:hypothetical protein
VSAAETAPDPHSHLIFSRITELSAILTCLARGSRSPHRPRAPHIKPAGLGRRVGAQSGLAPRHDGGPIAFGPRIGPRATCALAARR